MNKLEINRSDFSPALKGWQPQVGEHVTLLVTGVVVGVSGELLWRGSNTVTNLEFQIDVGLVKLPESEGAQ